MKTSIFLVGTWDTFYILANASFREEEMVMCWSRAPWTESSDAENSFRRVSWLNCITMHVDFWRPCGGFKREFEVSFKRP
jgi:hypothetical protein